MIKESLLMQAHAEDGSALEGCLCIPKKHSYKIEALAEEGAQITANEKEKAFYQKLAPAMREVRKAITDETWDFPTNPFGTSKADDKLDRCISEVEIKCCGEHTTDYSKCSCNPAAVCHASIGH